MPSNLRDDVVYSSPADASARENLANVCVAKLGIEMPALVDGFDDATDEAYAAWPDRLYIVDREGRVAYKSGAGPFGFKPADLERALVSLVVGSSPR